MERHQLVPGTVAYLLCAGIEGAELVSARARPGSSVALARQRLGEERFQGRLTVCVGRAVSKVLSDELEEERRLAERKGAQYLEVWLLALVVSTALRLVHS